MLDEFDGAQISHVVGLRLAGGAATRVVTAADFAAAAAEIAGWEGYEPTPLMELAALAGALGLAEVFYKDEASRFGLGSFKALGGAYAALRTLQRAVSETLDRPVAPAEIREGRHAALMSGIVLTTATDGNHGRALAWGCRRFGVPCRIYIHAGVSAARATALHALGADVVRIEGNYDDSVRLCREEAAAHGWFVVSDTSWPGHVDPPRDVMAGYGVMAKEICDVLYRPPTHVCLQAGVGGLAAAVAAGLRQHWGGAAPRIVVVEPDRAACLFESARTGGRTDIRIKEETLMAGLSCGEPSALAWEILAEEAKDFLTVPDCLVGAAMRLLARPLGQDPEIKAGESAVAGLVALIAAARHEELRPALGLDETSRVLLIGSEGATDPERYAALMATGSEG